MNKLIITLFLFLIIIELSNSRVLGNLESSDYNNSRILFKLYYDVKYNTCKVGDKK